jgi:regulator of sigma E protease
MDLIAGIPVVGGFLATVLPFVVVLGHRRVRPRVRPLHRGALVRDPLGGLPLGFGPVIWSRRDKRGTLWQVAALPLGGYVKFLGDSDGSSRADPASLAGMTAAERAESFHGASVGRRMLTVLAGPVFNFILTVVVFAGLILWQGVPLERPVLGEMRPLPNVEQPLRAGDVVLEVNGTPVEAFGDIYEAAAAMPAPGADGLHGRARGRAVEPGGALRPAAGGERRGAFVPRERGGLRPGDVILSADGRRLVAFEELRQTVLASGGRSIPLEVWRGGETLTLPIAPIERDTQDGEGGFERRVMIGIAGAPLYVPAMETPAPWRALGLGVARMADVIVQSLNGIPAHHHRGAGGGEPPGSAWHRAASPARRRARGW